MDVTTGVMGEIGGVLIGKTAGFILGKAKTLYNFSTPALREMGEEALARQYGTIKPAGKGSSMKTSIGPRKVDCIPEGMTVNNTKGIFESKVGLQKYSGKIIAQFEKDAELLATGKVDEVTWVFFRSPSTGSVAANAELLQQPRKAGIKTQITGDIPQDIIDKVIIRDAPTKR